MTIKTAEQFFGIALGFDPDQERDDHGRFASGGGTSMAPDKGGQFGGGLVKNAEKRAGGVATADNAIKEFNARPFSERKTEDYQVLIDAEKTILASGPKFDGFEDREGSRLVAKVSGDGIKNAKADAKRTLTSAGYQLQGKSKMLGGSETIDTYKHPSMPNHAYTVHTNPRTRGGVKEAVITIKVESRKS